MAKLYNLARMTTATTGTGDITLGSAVSGYLTFALAGVADGEIVRYAIKDGANSEIGFATYVSATTKLQTRTVEKSTNSDSAISLSGTAEVFITPSKKDFFNVSHPQGRLSLVTATPVITSTQSAKTTIYYTPYIGQLCPLYDGTSFNMHDLGGELSQATTDTTKSPAAVAASSVYDLFVWLDGSTYRCTRGAVWTNDTTRAAGLTLQNGISLNTSSITNGPAALRGTWVGTVRSNGSSQIDWIYGASGVAAWFGIWNMYNRVSIGTLFNEGTSSWTYNSATPRALNGSSIARVSMVRGLDEEAVSLFLQTFIDTVGGSTSAYFGIGLDSTNTFTTKMQAGGAGASCTASYAWNGLPGLGFHYLQQLEAITNAGSYTAYGQNVLASFAVNLRA